jgi:hypothetical protein
MYGMCVMLEVWKIRVKCWKDGQGVAGHHVTSYVISNISRTLLHFALSREGIEVQSGLLSEEPYYFFTSLFSFLSSSLRYSLP